MNFDRDKKYGFDENGRVKITSSDGSIAEVAARPLRESKPETRKRNPIKLFFAILMAAATLVPAAAQARTTTITSYRTITGTTYTTINTPGRKPTKCSSYTYITGTTRTQCR
jgi:hypothetical protein